MDSKIISLNLDYFSDAVELMVKKSEQSKPNEVKRIAEKLQRRIEELKDVIT